MPLGYIPEVPHTYAYWDLNYALANEKARRQHRLPCRLHCRQAPVQAAMR